MPRRSLIAALAFFVAAVALLLAGLLLWRPMPTPKPPLVVGELPAICRDTGFEGVPYAVCEIDPHRHAVVLARADGNGKPYGSLQAFDTVVTAKGAPVLLAMNAGMYHKGLGPVGLFVEDGRQETPLNTAEGEGNFFLKPNGVFFVRPDGSAGVLETGAYAAAHPDVAYATQSGPMLVIDGAIHPRFEENGSSRYIRNGVGVRADGTVVLAISRSPVSLGSFARLFRDRLSCPNALFLDGAISSLSDGERTLIGGKDPVGPILAVREK
ncbi:phosphodiester glycosidase family protein [Mesorhizobium sp. CN5-321]|uniref:phosphodiester glycosidase family protein n=1 Tax=Mesorhizobium hunchu TaxID=3157708 RepID=UPI0032B73C6C